MMTLASLVARATHLLNDGVVAHAKDFGLSPTEERVLVVLAARDGLTMSELVRRARVKQPTLSKAIDSLERKRLVERARSDEDLRYCRVLLSKPGRVVAERLLRCVCQHWAALYRRLGTGDLESLERALANLNRALDDMARGAYASLTTSVR